MATRLGLRAAIVGEGVSGLSTALAMKEASHDWQLTVFSDRPFEDTCSFGPAGIFRLDETSNPRNKKWAEKTFERFAHLYRNCSPQETGVKLVSGFIQSENEELLKSQERAMSDIVYNFQWLNAYEKQSLFNTPTEFAIHFTSFSSEGRRYVPWLKKRIEEYGQNEFLRKKINSLDELAKQGEFDVVINCAGIDGGKLARDDDTVCANRGVAIEVEAGWHKHFNYHNLDTFTIPMTNTVFMGTLRQSERYDLAVTEEDRKDIWQRNVQLNPTLKGAKVISEWVGLRPTRPTVRLEHSNTLENANGAKCHIIHNYGHGGNGFTMSWGCAVNVVEILNNL